MYRRKLPFQHRFFSLIVYLFIGESYLLFYLSLLVYLMTFQCITKYVGIVI